MSSKLYQSQLIQLQTDKAKLERDLATERTRIVKLQKEANKLQEDIGKTKSETTRKNMSRQLLSKQNDIAKCSKKISDIEQKITIKLKAISQKMSHLTKAEESEIKKRQKAELQHIENVNDAIDQQTQLENTRKTIKLFSNREGEALRLSQEAIDAAKQLLEMLRNGKIEKESQIVKVSTYAGVSYLFSIQNEPLIDFPVPIADVKELAAYGVISLQERYSKGRTSGWDMLILPERLKEIATGKVLPDVFRVFYSWQSWINGNTNRHFILSAIERAVEKIRRDETIRVEPVVDRDTLGSAGSVDIVATIFEKIENSAIFVCDVTIITPHDAIHHSPNPNVMVELGYAAAVLGWERIICVINTAYGTVEKLPFDLRSRRMLSYHLPVDVENKADTRKNLINSLQEAISVIIEQLSPNSDDTDASNDI